MTKQQMRVRIADLNYEVKRLKRGLRRGCLKPCCVYRPEISKDTLLRPLSNIFNYRRK